MIRIDVGADLADMWGGQTHFAVAVYMTVDGETDIIGAGLTVAEAVTDARETMRAWGPAPAWMLPVVEVRA